MSEVYIPTMTFGDRLRRLRLDLHLTQGELAEQLAVSSATIGKYELLDRPTRAAVHFAATIQLRYGVPREWLLTGHVPEQRGTHEYHAPVTGVVIDLADYRAGRLERAA